MNEIILINIAGDDQPGVTVAVTQLLARYGVNLLDMGQSVIHDTLSLGFLIEVPASSESSPLLKDILFAAHEMNMSARFTPIDYDDYQHWVAGQGKPRHIVTLLARKISAQHLAALTSVVLEYNLNVDRIDRLSGRVSLDGSEQQTKACVELSVRGLVDNDQEFRSKLMALSQQFDVDIAFQEDNMFRRNRRLVVFDMDSTLIEAEVIDELAKAAGVGEQVSAITERAMQGELDFQDSFRERLALLQGLDESVLESIAEQLPVTEGAEKLISTLKQLGYKTAIISGGFNYFGRYLQRKLGLDYVHANELDIVDGKVTGEVKGVIVDGTRKAELLQEIAAQEGVALDQVIAVGDGANDLPMLSIAGLGIAFRAKPIVKESAGQSISTLGLDGILYLLGISDRYTEVRK